MKEKNLSKMISAHHDPELYDIISRFLEQDVHEADQLSVTERHLCVLSALMGCQGKEAFMAEMHEALEDGVDPIAIREAVYQAAAYLGLGRILPFLHTADALMQEHGLSLPLPPQGTTNADDRFEKGLDKQVQLFGEGMRKQQSEAPQPRRNINRWLADNCVGDYYTRGGLDYKQREMITFCFLAALGGCEPQLTSHAGANLRIGNDNAFLIQVISQCLPYIGYPRSLNALRCVNDAAQAAR